MKNILLYSLFVLLLIATIILLECGSSSTENNSQSCPAATTQLSATLSSSTIKTVDDSTTSSTLTTEPVSTTTFNTAQSSETTEQSNSSTTNVVTTTGTATQTTTSPSTTTGTATQTTTSPSTTTGTATQTTTTTTNTVPYGESCDNPVIINVDGSFAGGVWTYSGTAIGSADDHELYGGSLPLPGNAEDLYDVVIQYSTPTTGVNRINVSACSNTFQSAIGLSSFCGLYDKGWDNELCITGTGGYLSEVTVNPDTTYYIVLEDVSGSTISDISIEIEEYEHLYNGEDCSHAIDIKTAGTKVGDTWIYNGSATGISDDYELYSGGSPFPWNADNYKDIVIEYQVPFMGVNQIDVRACNSTYDNAIAISKTCGDYDIEWNSNGCTSSTKGMIDNLYVDAFTTYYIVVEDTSGADISDVYLEIEERQVDYDGESCDSALNIKQYGTNSGSTWTYSGTASGLVDDYEFGTIFSPDNYKDVVFSFSVPIIGATYNQISVYSCSNTFDAQLGISTDCGKKDLGLDDTSCTSSSSGMIENIWVSPGSTYYIVMEDKSGAPINGNVHIVVEELSSPPMGENCGSAIDINASASHVGNVWTYNGAVEGQNNDTTGTCSFLFPVSMSEDVIFKFTPSATTSTIDISACGTNGYLVMLSPVCNSFLNSGLGCDKNSCSSGNSGEIIGANISIPGIPYYITVEKVYGGTISNVNLSITEN